MNELKWSAETFQHYVEVKNHYEDKPDDIRPTPWVTMLYGSQNYGLDAATSDVDTKTMLLPTLKMVALSDKRISTELTMKDGSLDNCKDLREMFGNYLKGNINFVETLFTRYFTVDEDYAHEFWELREHRHLIANARPQKLMHMACGMARQKYAAFEKAFEGKKEVLAQYGYDPKQLHHLVRLYHFMKTYSETLDFEQALLCCHRQRDHVLHKMVMAYKMSPYRYEIAFAEKEKYMAMCEELCDKAVLLPEDNGFEEAKGYLDGLAMRLITRHIRKEVTEQ